MRLVMLALVTVMLLLVVFDQKAVHQSQKLVFLWQKHRTSSGADK